MKVLLLFLSLCFMAACTTKAPKPEETQIVDGKSIVIPPEYDKVP